MRASYLTRLQQFQNQQQLLIQKKKSLEQLNFYSGKLVLDYQQKEKEISQIQQQLFELKDNVDQEQSNFDQFKLQFKDQLQDYSKELQGVENEFKQFLLQFAIEQKNDFKSEQQMSQNLNSQLQNVMKEVSQIQEIVFKLDFKSQCKNGYQRVQEYKGLENEIKSLEKKVQQDFLKLRSQEENFAKQICKKNALNRIIQAKDEKKRILLNSILAKFKIQFLNLKNEFLINQGKKNLYSDCMNQSLQSEQQELTEQITEWLTVKASYAFKKQDAKSQLLEKFQSELKELDKHQKEITLIIQQNNINENCNQNDYLAKIFQNTGYIEGSIEGKLKVEYEFIKEIAKIVQIDQSQGKEYYNILSEISSFFLQLELFQKQMEQLKNKEIEYLKVKQQKIKLQQQIKQFNNELDELIGQFVKQEVKNLIENQEKSIIGLQQVIIQLQRNYQQNLNEIENYRLEKEKCVKNLVESRQEYDKLKSQILKKQGTIDELKKKIELYEEETEQLQERLNGCKQSNYDMQKDIAMVSSFLENKINNNVQSEQSYDEINQMKELLNTVQELGRQFQQNSENIDILKAIIKNQQWEINEQNSLIESLKNQLQQSQQKLEIETSQVLFKQKIIDSQEAKLLQSQRLLDELGNQKERLDSKIQKLSLDQQELIKQLKCSKEKEKNMSREEKSRQCEMEIQLIDYKKQLENLNSLSDQNDIRIQRLNLIKNAQQNLFKREKNEPQPLLVQSQFRRQISCFEIPG